MKIDRVTLLLLTMSILQQGYSICLVNKSLVVQVHPPPQLRYLQYHQKLRKFESCICYLFRQIGEMVYATDLCSVNNKSIYLIGCSSSG